MPALTARQCEALSFIKDTLDASGQAPSYAEIGKALGMASTSTVSRLVHGLERRGAIRLVPNRRRQIEIVDRPAPSDALGYLDYVARANVLREAAQRGLRPQAVVAAIVRSHYFGAPAK